MSFLKKYMEKYEKNTFLINIILKGGKDYGTKCFNRTKK